MVAVGLANDERRMTSVESIDIRHSPLYILMNQSKTVGYILIGVGAAILLLAAAWALTGSGLSSQAKVLVVAFAFVPAAVLAGLGIYTLNKGSAEAGEERVIKKQQKLLSMVQTQGKVDMANASIELGSTRDEVRELIRNLVGKQLFSGYVDWDGGVLYSVEASKIKDGTCPKCGGKLELAGKGIVKCPYCGSEVFLTA